MTVNSYLGRLAGQAIIRDQEKESIQRSITGIRNRLNMQFGKVITNQFVFGSYDRGTILPRKMDKNSDIDYMVVFNHEGLTPQGYLGRLRKFVQRHYSTSEFGQLNPTINLSLNHIRFELVPAISTLWGKLRIPAKASDYNDWIATDPTDFNDKLISANRSNENFIKPLVRLAKYWNACNGYVFESYELEQKVVEHGYWMLIMSGRNLRIKDYFYKFMGDLDVSTRAAQWRKDKISQLDRLLELAQLFEQEGNEARAENTISKLLPPVIYPAMA